MKTDYDAIVLGAGPAGEHCAGALAEGGLRVAIVERGLVGGECDYWACIPSKTLLRPGEALQAAREAPGAAERVSGIVDVRAALEWRDYMVAGYSDESKIGWLGDAGIDLIRGEGRLAGAGVVEVDGRPYGARDIVLATGSNAYLPPLPGLDELGELVWTNREATGLKAAPARLVVVGAGPVGVELAQAIGRMGAQVVILDGADHVLPKEPRPAGEALGKALRDEGIELHLGRHAARVARVSDGFELEYEDGTKVPGDRLLVATGRRPRVAGLGLESVGVEPAPGGVPVDDRMRVADGLWAIGDVTGIWPLTYVGKYQGRVAAANILGRPVSARYVVPRVIFTDPQVASVGEAEGEFSARFELSGVPRTSTYTRAYAERQGFLTLVSDGRTLTGAHAVGPEAGEWLQQATLAIRAELPLEVLYDTIQPFPTFSEAFLYALHDLRAQL